MKLTVRTEVTRRYETSLGREDLLRLLRTENPEIPLNAEIEFNVPSGGDYSGMTLEINEDNPIHVSWTEHSEE